MSRIGYGFLMPNGPEDPAARASFVADLDRNLNAIKGHLGSAWMADHVQFQEYDMLEAWATLTFFAARHPELIFGHTVLCQSFRNPALLGKTAATFQFLTGGRLVLGLGAGWNEEEYKAYNWPFPAPGVRVEELEDTVQIVKAMWTEADATFEGKHYSIHNVHSNPRPDPLPPIMIGGRRPRILRLAARHADWWDVSGFGVKIADYPAIVEEMKQACADVGRDFSTLRLTFSTHCAVARTEEEVKELAKDIREGVGFVGTTEQVIAGLRSFIDLGVTHFQLAFTGWPSTETVELFISDVLPHVSD